MSCWAHYNEIDSFAAAWLRQLIEAGHIAAGEVDERSIEDVRPDDLAGFTQCHFFAGIGVWSYALRQAGWPDDREVWTGSCPCQPFSAAGKGKGTADERHLWPAFHWLIGQRRPRVVLGEQVAGRPGLEWLDIVCTDLEGLNYASGAAITAACGVGAPHRRQRLYWMADDHSKRQQGEQIQLSERRQDEAIPEAAGRGGSRAMADTEEGRRGEGSEDTGGYGVGNSEEVRAAGCTAGGKPELMADTAGRRREPQQEQHTAGIQRTMDGQEREGGEPGPLCTTPDWPGPTNGHWRDADWLFCRDGKWRAVEPGTFPLVDGAPARVGRLRGYGNAIVAQQAQAFIEAAMEVTA